MKHLNKSAIVLLTTVLFPYHGLSFSVPSNSYNHAIDGQQRHSQTSLCMALTPIGPFCPFRSSAAVAVEPRIEELNSQAPEFASEVARIQMDVQMGNEPDKDRLFRVADGIDKAVENWESLLARLKLSGDFQIREYSKLTQAHLASSGVSPQSVASMMRWQAGCMRAMALNAPPPMPPSDLDLQQLMRSAASDKPPPSLTQMSAAEKISCNPFDDSALKTETIKKEYEQLCRDHRSLIEFGARYATFDPSGKIAFIDEIEKIEERWDVFFTRFSLMGELNGEFLRQCNAFLDSMNLNEGEYRLLLKKAHEIMRHDAEVERNNFSF